MQLHVAPDKAPLKVLRLELHVKTIFITCWNDVVLSFIFLMEGDIMQLQRQLLMWLYRYTTVEPLK